MREKAKALDQTIISRARQSRGNMDAIQRLELREQFAKVRADNDARLLAAFKRLSGGLSPEQQQMVNQLVGTHHHSAPAMRRKAAGPPGGFSFPRHSHSQLPKRLRRYLGE